MPKRGQYETAERGWSSRGSIPVVCAGCGTAIRTHPQRANKKRLFCSRECFFANGIAKERNANWRGSSQLKPCANCGSDFWAVGKPTPRNPKLYCSRRCVYDAKILYRTEEEQRLARREWSRARDARERAINKLGRHTPEEWKTILAAFDHRCARCGSDESLTRDHIKPLSKGGTDNIDNVQPLCDHCNKRKGAKEGPVPLRVLAIDLGLRAGWAIVEHGQPARSGSHQMKTTTAEFGALAREFKDWCDLMIKKTGADLVIFASPFVGRFANPANMKVLFGFATLLEMACLDRKIKCYECNEPEARRAFLTGVPRRSKEIKAAIIAACRLRGWPCVDNHAADALCVAAWGQECLDRDRSHLTTPLFA